MSARRRYSPNYNGSPSAVCRDIRDGKPVTVARARRAIRSCAIICMVSSDDWLRNVYANDAIRIAPYAVTRL